MVDCETETGGWVGAITRCGNVRHPLIILDHECEVDTMNTKQSAPPLSTIWRELRRRVVTSRTRGSCLVPLNSLPTLHTRHSTSNASFCRALPDTHKHTPHEARNRLRAQQGARRRFPTYIVFHGDLGGAEVSVVAAAAGWMDKPSSNTILHN